MKLLRFVQFAIFFLSCLLNANPIFGSQDKQNVIVRQPGVKFERIIEVTNVELVQPIIAISCAQVQSPVIAQLESARMQRRTNGQEVYCCCLNTQVVDTMLMGGNAPCWFHCIPRSCICENNC